MGDLSGRIERGGRIAIVAPASPAPEDALRQGVELLRSWGYEPDVMGASPSGDSYLAAPDEQRLAELHRALERTDVAAIWAARGGYGTARLLGELSFPVRASRPPLFGFSDISLLLAHAWQRSGWPAVHAPNVTTLNRLDEASLAGLRRLLEQGLTTGAGGLECIHPGVAIGPALPMNLTLLASVAGTPFQPRLAGQVLVLEETGEAPYRLDRLLVQVSRLGDFKELAALVVGDLEAAGHHPEVRRTLHELAARAALPCVVGFPMGHGARHLPLPLGQPLSVDATRGEVTPVTEGAEAVRPNGP